MHMFCVRFNCVLNPFYGLNLFKFLIAQQQKMFDKYGHIYLYEVALLDFNSKNHILKKNETQKLNAIYYALHDLIGKI